MEISQQILSKRRGAGTVAVPLLYMPLGQMSSSYQKLLTIYNRTNFRLLMFTPFKFKLLPDKSSEVSGRLHVKGYPERAKEFNFSFPITICAIYHLDPYKGSYKKYFRLSISKVGRGSFAK